MSNNVLEVQYYALLRAMKHNKTYIQTPIGAKTAEIELLF